MAGLGVKLFLSGDVLSSAEVNGYLMDQSICRFATTVARDSAFGDGIPVANGGSGKPQLSEGRAAWVDNINELQIYDGAQWVTISQVNSSDLTIDNKTANYILVIGDKNKLIEMNLTGTANTVTIPTNSTVAFPIGTQISVVQMGTGKTQIVAGQPAVTEIRATPGTYLRAQSSSCTLVKRATDEWYVFGDLSAT